MESTEIDPSTTSAVLGSSVNETQTKTVTLELPTIFKSPKTKKRKQVMEQSFDQKVIKNKDSAEIGSSTAKSVNSFSAIKTENETVNLELPTTPKLPKTGERDPAIESSVDKPFKTEGTKIDSSIANSALVTEIEMKALVSRSSSTAMETVGKSDHEPITNSLMTLEKTSAASFGSIEKETVNSTTIRERDRRTTISYNVLKKQKTLKPSTAYSKLMERLLKAGKDIQSAYSSTHGTKDTVTGFISTASPEKPSSSTDTNPQKTTITMQMYSASAGEHNNVAKANGSSSMPLSASFTDSLLPRNDKRVSVTGPFKTEWQSSPTVWRTSTTLTKTTYSDTGKNFSVYQRS